MGFLMSDFDAAVDRVIAQLENVDPLLTAIGEYFQTRTRERFESGGPVGQKWKGVSQYTLDRKSRLGNSGVNVFTSNLKDSFYYRVENSELIFTTDVEYAEFVELERPVLLVDDADNAAIDEMLSNYLV